MVVRKPNGAGAADRYRDKGSHRVSQLQKFLFTMALWFEPRSFVLIDFFSALTAKNFL
jgi:hypothetical protein